MIHVLKPGILTTVQDLGRNNVAHLGVAPGGAADTLSLRLANLLLGNGDGLAALEMTLVGARLEFEADTVVALVGGRVHARLDGVTVPMGQTIAVCRGQILDVGPIITGTRTYLAVSGGIQVPQVLGSRATDTVAGFGAPAVVAGVRLPITPSQVKHLRYLRQPPRFGGETQLRITLGPDDGGFVANAVDCLCSASFEVNPASDRTGMRLRGPRLQQQDDKLNSKGMLTGAIQVPPDGNPIILLPNHGPTGGYRIIGVVISADIPRAAQARPGGTVRFQVVPGDEALAILRREALYIRNTVSEADTLLLQTRELLQIFDSRPTLRGLTVRDANHHIALRR